MYLITEDYRTFNLDNIVEIVVSGKSVVARAASESYVSVIAKGESEEQAKKMLAAISKDIAHAASFPNDRNPVVWLNILFQEGTP